MEDYLEFKDESGDRKYFAIIPYIIINGYDATTSGVYAYIKRKCGESEDGTWCEIKRKAAKRLGLSYPTFSKILKKLEKDERIKCVGQKIIKTHPVRVYKICDIWKENILSYQEIGKKSETISERKVKNKNLTKVKNKNSKNKQYKEKNNNVNSKFSKENSELTQQAVKTPKRRNKDIDELIDLLKEKLGLRILDGTEKMNRRYCWLAIKKFKKEGVKMIIEFAAQDEFWQNKITDFKTLYYNGVKIASSFLKRPKYIIGEEDL